MAYSCALVETFIGRYRSGGAIDRAGVEHSVGLGKGGIILPTSFRAHASESVNIKPRGRIVIGIECQEHAAPGLWIYGRAIRQVNVEVAGVVRESDPARSIGDPFAGSVDIRYRYVGPIREIPVDGNGGVGADRSRFRSERIRDRTAAHRRCHQPCKPASRRNCS